MSDLIVLGGLGLAIVWSRLTSVFPFETTLVLNHFPSLVTAIGLALAFVGARLRPRSLDSPGPQLRPGRMLWPLLLLATLVLAGSFYAQLVERIGNTFRNLGLYMWVSYLMARFIVSSRDPELIISIYFAMLAISGVGALLTMIAVFFLLGKDAAPFHELEFFIIPLIVYIATRSGRMSWWEAVVCWGGISSAIFFQKNSAYLIALGTIAYLWIMYWRHALDRQRVLQRALQFLTGVTLIMLTLGLYVHLRSSSAEMVPTGNTEFRINMYERAWFQFLDSPLLGTGFSVPASREFNLYDTGVANNILPTHSDVLDILANGGVTGFGLWLFGHVLVLRAVNQHILRRQKHISPHMFAISHTFACMLILGVVTYAFNPLLLNPVKALLIWGQLGMLVGLVSRYQAKNH